MKIFRKVTADTSVDHPVMRTHKKVRTGLDLSVHAHHSSMEPLGRPKPELQIESSSRAATKIRAVKFGHICEQIKSVPGEESALINDLFRELEVTVSGQTSMFGPLDNEEKICNALCPPRASPVELKFDNFMMLRRGTHAGKFRESLVNCGVLTGREDGKPLGYFFLTSYLDGNAQRRDRLDYLMLDVSDPRTRGLGDTLCNAMDEMARHCGTVSKSLQTAWIGRKFWALRGYDFESAEERHRILKYLSRFLRYYDQSPESLVLDREDGSVSLNLPEGERGWDMLNEKLVHTWDVVALKSLRGPINLPILLGNDTVVVRDLEVGSAFMLGNWQEPHLANLVPRNWVGTFTFGDDTPSQHQLARHLQAKQLKEARGV